MRAAVANWGLYEAYASTGRSTDVYDDEFPMYVILSRALYIQVENKNS